MNHRKLNEFLAVEVMGWRKIGLGQPPNVFAYWEVATPEKPAVPISCGNWSPSTNTGQAMMCLEKMENWVCGLNDETYCDESDDHWCEALAFDGGCSGVVTEKSLPLAISLACARARGFEE